MTDNPTPENRPRPVERTDGKRVPLPEEATPGKAGPVRVTRRKFGGTQAQIRGALSIYKYCAWISGTFLLLLVVEMITRYVFGYDLMAGATNAATGENVALGWLNRNTGNLTGGLNISTGVLIVHGWFYVIYLLACFRLWLLMRWPLAQLIVMALGGVVPFLSFIVERKIHRETVAQVAANPKSTKRY
ncbi:MULTISPECIES: DUF3817 domain-containing protein [Kocuria]|uniref:DUF3817 domain-containing protein n=1 Tax=Kocuria TaxID=57493 RepID=UPI0006610ACA|nr:MULTISPECIES: DUF3817 domain-containing protein [Kocuria]MCT1367260.1 DUF3817 domain-containing protein [Rothia sp. p3-SID1597]RUQ23444.1 DUF3817 domain-containing protein [Kocuria sp. HSID16901]